MSAEYQQPNPASPKYRIQVTQDMQNLLAGRRPRNPHLMEMSTGRLILEGVVENVKIYRLHKEDEAKKAKEGKDNMRKHEHGRGHRRGRSHDGHQQHHRERSKGRQQHHDRRDRSGERRHHHHDRKRSGERRHHRERSGERHRRHGSQEKHCNGSKGKKPFRGIYSGVRESPPNDDPGLEMTGGAGPAGTLPQYTPPEPRGRVRSRSQLRAGHRTRDHTPQQGRARTQASPTRRLGPDGKTPFGQLPRREAGVGLKDHVLNTYKHIKAEHEEGFRARTVVEQAADALRGKSAGKHVRDVNDLPKRDRKRDGHRRRDKENVGDGRRRQEKHDQGDEHHGNQSKHGGRGRPSTPYRLSSGSPRQYHSDAAGASPLHESSPTLARQHDQHNSRTPSPPTNQVQDATPPSPPFDHGRVWTQTPTQVDTRIRSNSLPGHGAASEFYSPLQIGRISLVRPPPPPGPPPMPDQRHGMTPDQTALFGEIQAGKRLRKVSNSEKRYMSQKASLDGVSDDNPGHAYHATPHSRNVEDRERAQASNRTWSDAGDGDDESERMRAFKQGLAAKFGRVSPQRPRASTEHDKLTPDVRRRTSMKAVDVAADVVPVSSDEKVSFNQDGAFSRVGVVLDTPSWDWSNFQKKK